MHEENLLKARGNIKIFLSISFSLIFLICRHRVFLFISIGWTSLLHKNVQYCLRLLLESDNKTSQLRKGKQKQHHWFVWLQESWVSGSCQSTWSPSESFFPFPLSPLPQVCGCSRCYNSFCVHLFVFSHYWGWCCLGGKVKFQPQRGQWESSLKPWVCLAVDWGQTNHTDHCETVLMGTW